MTRSFFTPGISFLQSFNSTSITAYLKVTLIISNSTMLDFQQKKKSILIFVFDNIGKEPWMCIHNKNSVCKLTCGFDVYQLSFRERFASLIPRRYQQYCMILYFYFRAYFFFKTSKYKEGFLTHYLDCILKIKLIFRRQFLLQFVSAELHSCSPSLSWKLSLFPAVWNDNPNPFLQ